MTNIENTVIAALNELKAKNITTINVEALTTITNRMIIATGTSSRHVKALSDRVLDHAEHNNIETFGVEGEENSEWILIDLGDTVVHVMQEATREYYNLEKLWSPLIAEDAEDLKTPSFASA